VLKATSFSDGKKRELDAARHAAIWPDATDDELKSPDLKDMLIARLPGLVAEFQNDLSELGLTY
jgi:hypothetical protein